MSIQVNLIEIQLECLRATKNTWFYRAKFCNRPIVSIDGYDGTVHRGPFQKYRSHPIAMDGPDVIVRETL